MCGELSENAKRIIDAGLSAAKSNGNSDPMAASDKAVERAAGWLGLVDPPQGDVKIIEPLVEIAQLHVRQQVANASK